MSRFSFLTGMAVTFAGFNLFAAPTTLPENTRTDNSNGIELRIGTRTRTVVEGQPVPVTITLTNRGRVPVMLVAPGDGSNCGWRTPVVGWSVLDAKNAQAKHPAKWSVPKGIRRCGNVNSLRKNELLVLKPGESKVLSTWAGMRPFTNPGSYRVVFYYANDPQIKWRGLARHDPIAMEMVKKSNKCTLRSNELRLEVKAKQE